MKRVIVVLIFVLLASTIQAPESAERDKVMERVSDNVFAGRSFY